MEKNLYLTNYKDNVQNIVNLFMDESRKDITFTFIDSDVTVKAHKCILEAASPVFKSLLSGSFAENDVVLIDDISPEVFKLFLSGIYLNDIASKAEKVADPLHIYADLYYAAEKYDIKDIRELSRKFMIDNCHEGNTHWLLRRAKLFNLPELEAVCKDYFQQHTYHVLASHIRLNLHDGYFHELLDMENILVKNEFDLYMALQAMVDNKKLPDFSKCLSKIRFLTMKIRDILSCKLLSAEDKVAIISIIEGKQICSMPTHLSGEKKPRKFSIVKKYNRQLFWTAIMLKSEKYEDYFEDFFKQMEIAGDSEERTKSLIKEGRNAAAEKRHVDFEVVSKITRTIFNR